MGAPAYEIREFHKSYIHFKNLDDIVKRLEKLEKLSKKTE
jgi:UDP-3-O-[3-hydroxymyristoyl] glucosamine N-acyltransferase